MGCGGLPWESASARVVVWEGGWWLWVRNGHRRREWGCERRSFVIRLLLLLLLLMLLLLMLLLLLLGSRLATTTCMMA